MEISLRNLPSDGLDVTGPISKDRLNSRMNESAGNLVEFGTDPIVTLKVYPVLGGAEVRGDVEARYTQPCSRCMESLSERLTVKISLALKFKTSSSSDSIEEESEAGDPGLMLCDGDNVNLEEYLQESIIVALPFAGPEHINCPGFAQAVSREIRSNAAPRPTTKLGDLLKKAGVS